MSLFLRIADFVIQINPKNSCSVELDEGYQPFAIESCNAEPDLIVNAFGQLPNEPIAVGKLLYSAKMPEGELWNVSKNEDTYIFNVFNSEQTGVLQQVCTTDSHFREWNVYMVQRSPETTSIDPLKYPLGPLLMYYLTVKNDAIMIHASGISDDGIGRIFTGVSGKGKSTMARLWFDAGAEVLNDDRLIIRKEAVGYSIHNTPMFYTDRPRRSRFGAAYIIYHAKENKLQKLSGAEAVSALAANCIQHGYDRSIIEHHLHFLSEMVETVGVHSLGVVPTHSVLEVIRNDER